MLATSDHELLALCSTILSQFFGIDIGDVRSRTVSDMFHHSVTVSWNRCWWRLSHFMERNKHNRYDPSILNYYNPWLNERCSFYRSFATISYVCFAVNFHTEDLFVLFNGFCNENENHWLCSIYSIFTHIRARVHTHTRARTHTLIHTHVLQVWTIMRSQICTNLIIASYSIATWKVYALCLLHLFTAIARSRRQTFTKPIVIGAKFIAMFRIGLFCLMRVR